MWEEAVTADEAEKGRDITLTNTRKEERGGERRSSSRGRRSSQEGRRNEHYKSWGK